MYIVTLDVSEKHFTRKYVNSAAWIWKRKSGRKMVRDVSSTFQVSHRVQCLANCTVSPTCDSYNYRASDKTCQFVTHDTPLIANSADMVDDIAWSWWRSSFTVVVWVQHIDATSPLTKCIGWGVKPYSLTLGDVALNECITLKPV